MNLVTKIQQAHENFTQNKWDYLPMPPELGRIASWMPGFVRGDISCLTGTPSSGKTSLAKFIFLHHGVKWAVQNKKNFKIKYFGLEETEEEFDWSLLSHQLYKRKGLRYNIRDFTGIGNSVPPKHWPLVEDVEPKVETIKKYVDYHDNIFNSYGIYKEVRELARSRGKFYLGNVKLTDTRLINGDKWDRYVPDDPNEFVLIVVDH